MQLTVCGQEPPGMADGLPEGLVTNSEAITRDIQGVDHIDTEDLAHLWRGNRFSVCSVDNNMLTMAFQSTRPIETFLPTTLGAGWRTSSGGSGVIARSETPSEASR